MTSEPQETKSLDVPGSNVDGKPMWWPMQVLCGPDMVDELDTLKEIMLQRFGIRVSRSTIVYNIVNDAIPALLERIMAGDAIHRDWQRAPGMETRPKPGRRGKRFGQFKGKRREIKPARGTEPSAVPPAAPPEEDS